MLKMTNTKTAVAATLLFINASALLDASNSRRYSAHGCINPVMRNRDDTVAAQLLCGAITWDERILTKRWDRRNPSGRDGISGELLSG